MRILQYRTSQDLIRFMRQVKVDPYGIKIMYPKGMEYCVRLDRVSNICANILKQEMLSLGADAAVSRDTLTGKAKATDCLLLGNLSQFNLLCEKLAKQPFGLHKLGRELGELIAGYQKEDFLIRTPEYKLRLKPGRPLIMGIVNLTPDSFSGDGQFSSGYGVRNTELSRIIDFARKMAGDGADIIDIGGESSRPGARPVPVKTELARIIPALKLLVKKIKLPISVDTYNSEVAKAALDNGASIINDITGLRNPKMIRAAARSGCAVVIMHMRGVPGNMQKNPRYQAVVAEIIEFLGQRIKAAQQGGIIPDKIIIDPGIGFGKTLGHNLEILKNLRELKVLVKPVLIGTSRKSFLGKILNQLPQERINGTIASCLIAAQNGANILRVHDVAQVKQAMKIYSATQPN